MVCESREDAANISVVFGHSDPIDVTSDAQWFYYCTCLSIYRAKNVGAIKQ